MSSDEKNLPKPKANLVKINANWKRMYTLQLLEVIKKNQPIQMKKLIAKLCVNEPYLNENTAINMIKNLILDDQVKLDNEDNVTICK